MKHSIALIALIGWTSHTHAQTPEALSEKDFLSEMPIVLSVSRLPQRLDETPGAVTLLDREMIRLSGARDVADLLRLVPGFQTSNSFEGIAPQASYHGGFDIYSNRLQILVDGRSAYSPYFIGSIEPGLQAVALSDIERIEVLRGSNSAAYGARAMLGVVNIVTRHTVDTQGLQASQTWGGNGINDTQARIGWAGENASYRLSLDRRADDGLSYAVDQSQVERANFRVDWRTSANDEIQLRAGSATIYAGKGMPGNDSDPLRDTAFGTNHVQLDWRRNLGEDADLAFNFAHTQEFYRDSFPYSLVDFKKTFEKPLLRADYPKLSDAVFQYYEALYKVTQIQMAGLADSFDINGGGRSSSSTVSLQHTFRQSSALRVVWGGEFRREQITSQGLYNTGAPFVTDFTRLFANAEWRLAPALVLNAGAMAENNSVSGDSLAPRVMLNWHAAPGQTLRAGVSKATRPPSTFEKYGNIQYVSNGQLLRTFTLSRGNIQPESVLSRELGYLGEFPKLRLNLDVRVFHEQMTGLVAHERYALSGDTSLLPVLPWDYFNGESFAIRGLEYQLKWQPWRGAQLNLNQAYIKSGAQDINISQAAPRLASTLSFFQKLPGGLDFSLVHQHSGNTKLQGSSRFYENPKRTDVRLGWPLRFGANQGEVAIVVQNLGASYRDFQPDTNFERRAFVTFRVEN